MIVLGIETSCDDTAAAIVQHDSTGLRVLAAARATQDDTHRPYGGIVPELATRDHVNRLPHAVRDCLQHAALRPEQLDLVAATRGPGLSVALLIGHTFGKVLAAALGKPFLGVNHLRGHIISPYLTPQGAACLGQPAVCLLVSGGHTLLARLDAQLRITQIGATRDDAAGEAFDKAARLLGLPHPGGPHLAAAAMQGRPDAFSFPRPMLNEPGLDFSFSGLKTALRVTLERLRSTSSGLSSSAAQLSVADLAASYQQAIVDTLVGKTRHALQITGAAILTLAGGVAANTCLRAALADMCQSLGVQFLPAAPEHCTDNAVMIAATGALLHQVGHTSTLEEQVEPRPGLH